MDTKLLTARPAQWPWACHLTPEMSVGRPEMFTATPADTVIGAPTHFLVDTGRCQAAVGTVRALCGSGDERAKRLPLLGGVARLHDSGPLNRGIDVMCHKQSCPATRSPRRQT